MGVSGNNRGGKTTLFQVHLHCYYSFFFSFCFISLAFIYVFIVLGFLACCVGFACSPGGCVCSLWVLPPTVRRHCAREANEQIQIGRRCERECKRLLVFLRGPSINWQLKDGNSALAPLGQSPADPCDPECSGSGNGSRWIDNFSRFLTKRMHMRYL